MTFLRFAIVVCLETGLLARDGLNTRSQSFCPKFCCFQNQARSAVKRSVAIRQKRRRRCSPSALHSQTPRAIGSVLMLLGAVLLAWPEFTVSGRSCW